MVRKLATRAVFAARIMSGRPAALSAFAVLLGVIGPAAAQPRDGRPGSAMPGQSYAPAPWQGGQGFGQGSGQGIGQGTAQQGPRRSPPSIFAPSPRQESYTSAFEASAPPFAPAQQTSFAPKASPRAAHAKARPVFAVPAVETAAPRPVVRHKPVVYRNAVATHHRHAPKRPPVTSVRAAPPILTAPPPVLALPILAFTQPTPQRGLSPHPEPIVHPAPRAKPWPAPPPTPPTPVVAPPNFVAPEPLAHTQAPRVTVSPALKPVRTKVLRAISRRPEKARRYGVHHGKRHDKHRSPGFKGPVFTIQPPNYISPYVATNHTDGPPLDWPPRALRICDGPKAKLIAACRDLAAAR